MINIQPAPFSERPIIQEQLESIRVLRAQYRIAVEDLIKARQSNDHKEPELRRTADRLCKQMTHAETRLVDCLLEGER